MPLPFQRAAPGYFVCRVYFIGYIERAGFLGAIADRVCLFFCPNFCWWEWTHLRFALPVLSGRRGFDEDGGVAALAEHDAGGVEIVLRKSAFGHERFQIGRVA